MIKWIKNAKAGFKRWLEEFEYTISEQPLPLRPKLPPVQETQVYKVCFEYYTQHPDAVPPSAYDYRQWHAWKDARASLNQVTTKEPND